VEDAEGSDEAEESIKKNEESEENGSYTLVVDRLVKVRRTTEKKEGGESR